MTNVERAVQTNLSILLSNAAGLRQGNPEAIHDARIATRRLRALVPIAMAALPDEQRDAAAGMLRRIGRTLGSARDLDVALQQLEGLDLRVPSASRAITSLRLTLMERQASARRQMVKRLEELPLDDLASVAGMRASPLRLPWRSGTRAHAMDTAIESRTHELREDIERAGGVYFPKRAHAVRISVKKLRYLLEFAMDGPARKRTLKALKRAQEKLGTLHDRQTLADVAEEERAGGALPDDVRGAARVDPRRHPSAARGVRQHPRRVAANRQRSPAQPDTRTVVPRVAGGRRVCSASDDALAGENQAVRPITRGVRRLRSRSRGRARGTATAWLTPDYPSSSFLTRRPAACAATVS